MNTSESLSVPRETSLGSLAVIARASADSSPVTPSDLPRNPTPPIEVLDVVELRRSGLVRAVRSEFWQVFHVERLPRHSPTQAVSIGQAFGQARGQIRNCFSSDHCAVPCLPRRTYPNSQLKFCDVSRGTPEYKNAETPLFVRTGFEHRMLGAPGNEMTRDRRWMVKCPPRLNSAVSFD